MGFFDDAIQEHLELKRRHGASAAELDGLERSAFGSPEGIDADHDLAREAAEADHGDQGPVAGTIEGPSLGSEEASGFTPSETSGPGEPTEVGPEPHPASGDPAAAPKDRHQSPDDAADPLADVGRAPADDSAEAGAARADDPADPGSRRAEPRAAATDPGTAAAEDGLRHRDDPTIAPGEGPPTPELSASAAPAPPESPSIEAFDLSKRSFEIPDPVPDVVFSEEEAFKQGGYQPDAPSPAEVSPDTAHVPDAFDGAPLGSGVDEWTALEPTPGLEPLVEREESAAALAAGVDPASRDGGAAQPDGAPGPIAKSTAFFAIATALSRIAGLVREIVAAGFFGVKGVMSAFTIAFQIPNLVRSLFADAAIQAAFVPVFTEELEKNRQFEAFRLASNLLFIAVLVLGAMSGLLILAAPLIVPIFAPGFDGALGTLTVTLSRIMFPIVALLGISGLVVGILNSYHRFSVFAISPFFWNVAIIAVLVGLAPAFPEENKIYAYAIGVIVGTILQLAMVTWDLRNTPFRAVGVRLGELWTPEVRRVLLLMLPVTISLGLINFNLVINSFFGTLVSPRAPASIDKAFRIYMLPQGVFSVAVATVVFPTLARFAARKAFDDLRATMANGMRMIILLLIPAAAAILVLAEPMTQLVYQRGEFGPGQTELVKTALFWFALALPLNGLFLLLARTFFSLQRPWLPSAISAGNLLITAGAAAALYGPYGIAGIVGATVIATAVSVAAQTLVLRRHLHGLELGRFLSVGVRITVAAAGLAGVSWLIWSRLDGLLGESLTAQIVSLGSGLLAGSLVYAIAVLGMRVPEAYQIMRLVRRRSTTQRRPDPPIAR